MAKKEKGGKGGYPDMLTPLTEGPQKGDTGVPSVNNPPVLKPGDPLGFIPGGTGKGK